MLRVPALVLVLFLVLAVLQGCGSGLDGEQAEICRRIVPALVSDGGSITVLRVGAGTVPPSVKVDYSVRSQGRAPAIRWVSCRFAPEGQAARRVDLIAVATERGTMGDAALYLLKHYYIETPDAAAADPGPPKPGGALIPGSGSPRAAAPAEPVEGDHQQSQAEE